MNKRFLQQVFNTFSGYVYQFVGQIPPGESVSHFVTEKFVTAAADSRLTTTVVELPLYNAVVIYSTENIQSDEFVLVTDLVPEPDPEPEVPADETPQQG